MTYIMGTEHSACQQNALAIMMILLMLAGSLSHTDKEYAESGRLLNSTCGG